MTRMSMLIDRDERQLRSKLESSKADTFANPVITDFLYGAEDGSELGPSLQEIERYAQLRKWTSQNWTDLLKKYVYFCLPKWCYSRVFQGTTSIRTVLS